jgi:Domain of unknown function (DUF5679)
MEPIVEQPQITTNTNDNLYCIKCRTHTDNIDSREEQITSKGKPRSVVKATCAVCTKKKNRFIKSVKLVENLMEFEQEPNTEMQPKKTKIK